MYAIRSYYGSIFSGVVGLSAGAGATSGSACQSTATAGKPTTLRKTTRNPCTFRNITNSPFKNISNIWNYSRTDRNAGQSADGDSPVLQLPGLLNCRGSAPRQGWILMQRNPRKNTETNNIPGRITSYNVCYTKLLRFSHQ